MHVCVWVCGGLTRVLAATAQSLWAPRVRACVWIGERVAKWFRQCLLLLLSLSLSLSLSSLSSSLCTTRSYTHTCPAVAKREPSGWTWTEKMGWPSWETHAGFSMNIGTRSRGGDARRGPQRLR